MVPRVPHVLLVDDDADLRGMYSTHLSHSGMVVIEAPTGREGLRAARNFHPDVVVTDYSMPGMNGGELTRRLRADGRTSDIPIIAVSGDCESLSAHADVTLAKPCDPERLQHIIQDVLNRDDED